MIDAKSGSTLRIQTLPPRIDPAIGIDQDGTDRLIEVVKKSGNLLKFSNLGVPISASNLTVGADPVMTAKYDLKRWTRAENKQLSDLSHSEVQSISEVLPISPDPYVNVTYSDGSESRLFLSSSAVSTLDREGQTNARQYLDQGIILRFVRSHPANEGNVSYPQLYSPVLSSRGTLWALVSGTRVSEGSVAIAIDAKSGVISSIRRLVLPSQINEDSPDNPGGFLGPGSLVLSGHNVFITDRLSGWLAMYNGDF